MEDYVYVLDYLARGRGDVPSYKRKPIVYGVGENQFTLLEGGARDLKRSSEICLKGLVTHAPEG